MGNNLRLLYKDISRSVTPTVTTCSSGFPASNLFDGSRQTFWRSSATSSGQTVRFRWDVGSGNTFRASYIAVARADLLASVGITLAVAVSTSAASSSSFTDIFSTNVTSTALLRPTSEDYVREFTSTAFRSWEVRLTLNSSVGGPSFAGLMLGDLVELTNNPAWPGGFGPMRVHRGADLSLVFTAVPESQANALSDYIAAVTPAWPAEAPVRTRYGAIYGGQWHFLYDPLGIAFRQGATGAVPALLNVLLITPDAGAIFLAPDVYDVGPLGWQQIR